ncbi:MAG: cation:proton antiporter [Bryobacteraceae bacterium]
MLAFLVSDAGGEAAHIPLAMLIVFASAKIMAELFERFNQPGIVGEILAGILIGPGVLGWLQPDEFLRALSDLGAMFLLFRVGLEVKASELMAVGGTAATVAVSGVVVPFVLGWGIMTWWGASQIEAWFTGAALVATSVGITAQVLSAKRLLHAVASKIILAAAVIDDVLGLLVLAVVSSVASGKVDPAGLIMTAVLAIGFTLVVARWGTRTMSRVVPRVNENLRVGEAQFSMAMVLLFGLALLAVYTGVAAIVGAFLAGMALAESTGERVHDLAHGVTELLLPFFLVGIGLFFDPSVFSDPSNIVLAAIILVAAIVSKFVGCGLGAWRLGRADAVRVGVGMVPRGEVGMVVAQIGMGLGILTDSTYGVVVFMAIATTMVAPPLLGVAYRGMAPAPEREQEERFRLG